MARPAHLRRDDQLAVDTLRMLAVDMVDAAQSGHPGMPLGCAPMAWTLWSRHLRHDPADPDWPDRDRFVLSAGHGSALLYGLLHLCGYDLTRDDLAAFRQLHSRTPGHPERGETPGVETTTGPLGQGIATAVGMAIGEELLRSEYGGIVDHRTYVLAGDGCLMEGISHEAASLAGHLGLGRLIVLYDDNQITIDGATARSCSDDAAARFAAYGWHTVEVADGDDLPAIDAALTAAKADPRPSLVSVRTVIGAGAPTIEGTAAAHGTPLSASDLRALRDRLGWPDEALHVPGAARAAGEDVAAAGARDHDDWSQRRDAWAVLEPERAAELARRLAGVLPDEALAEALATVETGQRVATRQASAAVLAGIGKTLPELVGGSADLAGSTGTNTLPGNDFQRGLPGRLVNFGIREHAMGAVLNGLAAHGGFRPFGSTFLVFSDYLRPAIRLAALMRLPVVYVFTHDSVAVGEDGPTHQPVEHVESLRLIPGLAVLRPADDVETREAWRVALARRTGPTALILSRQALPPLGVIADGAVAETGARVVEVDGVAVERPVATILASGSEVALAAAAAARLTEQGTPTRVVSVPWRERFAELSIERRCELTGGGVVVAVEAGSPSGWVGLTGSAAAVLGVNGFGASGPGPQVQAHVGLTVEAVAAMVRSQLG